MGVMPNHSTFAPRPLLLAAVLAGSILVFFPQTQAFAQAPTPSQPSQPETTPAPANPVPALTPKAGPAKPSPAAAPLVLKTAKQNLFYAIGNDIGKKVGGQLKSQ